MLRNLKRETVVTRRDVEDSMTSVDSFDKSGMESV